MSLGPSWRGTGWWRFAGSNELYRNWASRLSVTMRQAHIGGDKLFVDYAGDTVPVIVDRLTGQVRPAQIFVAVLGASNFTYAEASWTQRDHPLSPFLAKNDYNSTF